MPYFQSIALLLTVLAVSASGDDQMKERTGLRNARYCEVLLVKGSLVSPKAEVYNTIGLNECPPEQWSALDAKQLQKQFGVKRVLLNGPRHFLMDRNALKSPGKVEKFGGLEARLLAQVEISPMQLLRRKPYSEATVERETRYVYEAGKYVHELTTPDGRVYIMQTYSLEIDKNLNEAALLNLASRLKPPKGWQYRSRKLDQDLEVRSRGGKATVLQDDLRNSYQLR